MVPTKIIRAAVERGLDGIGICDHNTAENYLAVKKAALGSGITVFGGMEITSVEEIHVLALFEEENKLFEVQNEIYRFLSGDNDENAFGYQWLVDHEDYVLGKSPRLLAGAGDTPLEGVVDLIHLNGGLAIASHVDRPVFSVISQLGFIPENIGFDAFEVTDKDYPEMAEIRKRGKVVRFSDAHYPADIGKRWTSAVLKDLSLHEFKMALEGAHGREITGVL